LLSFSSEQFVFSQEYWVFELNPSSSILKNTIFWKLDLIPSSVEKVGDTHFAGSVRRGQSESLDKLTQQGRCLPPRHLKAESDPVSKTLFSLEYLRMD
jgi:hypothetical protein